MKSEEAKRVLKRMLTPALEPDEFYSIKFAIKSIEENEKYEKGNKTNGADKRNEDAD